MTQSSIYSLESLEFLFQKRSQSRNQISPHAQFAVASVVNGQDPFRSQTAPDQAPKKRKILLDFNSCYRLWNPNEMALEIAKLKDEGFEVAFILKKDDEEDIFESSIEDKAEGDKKYDYKFKDKNGDDKSIFELSDKFIKENFSKLDHEKSIEKLSLVRDESIILSFEQFDEVDKIFKQEYWGDEKRVSVKTSWSYSFFEGDVEYPSYDSVVDSFKTNDTDDENRNKLKNLLTHEDFNIEDKKTLEALNNLFKLTDHGYRSLIMSIKNEKTLEALFDKIPSQTADRELKISMQKKILKKIWFKCSNFEDVVRKAQTLDEFKNKSLQGIATSLYEKDQDFLFANHLKSEPVFSFDILERYQGGNALNIFKAEYDYNSVLDNITIIYIIAQQQINQTSFGEKIKVNFALSKNKTQDNFIEFSLQLAESDHKQSLSLSNFINIFSDSKINQNFNLAEQFGDAIITSLKSQSLSKICELCNCNGFVQQLNDNQKTQFLDLLQNKIENASVSTIENQDIDIVLITLQHFLDRPKILVFAKSMISNSKKNILNFSNCNLTPAFQNLLLEMHEKEEINLNIELPRESKLLAKFGQEQLKPLLGFDRKISSQDSAESPLQITLFDLNEESLKKINEKIDSGELDPSKILSVDVLGVIRVDDATRIYGLSLLYNEDARPCLLIHFLQLFSNLKHARIDTRSLFPNLEKELNSMDRFNTYLMRWPKFTPIVNVRSPNFDFDASPTSLMQKLESLNVTLDLYDSFHPKSVAKAPPSTQQFSATINGDPIFIGDAKDSGASKADSLTTFSMEETGKIIKRPAEISTEIYTRIALRKLNPSFARLEDELFAVIDESKPISPEENASIEKFSQQDFEAKKTELGSSDSSDKTICSFSRNLQANAKNILPSISPDNKIIGYYTEPPSVDIQFFKDEKSGFYYANIATQCQIHYLIEGRELQLQTPNQDLKGLPEKIQNIITDYVGKNPENFPLSVQHDEYKLPDFNNREQFLDDIFNLKNKGSCGHRVASLAHKFEEKGLEYDKDFRIVRVNGSHVLMEVKKQNSDEWVTLNLGGAEGILEKASEPNPPLVLPPPPNPLPRQLSMSELQPSIASSEGSDDQSGGQIYGVADENAGISLLTRCMSCLGCGSGVVYTQNREQPALVTSAFAFPSQLHQPEPDQPKQNPQITYRVTSLEELAKIEERKLQNLDILKSALDNLHQIKKVDDLESFKTDFEQFVKKDQSSALLLKTTRGEELKNYLLRMSSSSQNTPSPDLTDSTLNASSLGFQVLYFSSPQDLTAKKPTLHIGEDAENTKTETKTAKITAETPLLSFLENAKQNTDKQHVLIIDWSNFDASSQVAFNTMFDKGSRKIDDQEIPDNVKIVCIDSSKQQTTDSSILSRFGEALDLSSIPKNQFAKSKNETSSGVREIEEIACDGEGLVNWKEKLFGRIIVDGDAIKWEKSEFVKSLKAFGKDGIAGSNPDQHEQKDLHINFKNFSSSQQQEMKIFLEQAKAMGSIDYHDYKIIIPQDLSINFTQKEFEFAEVLTSFQLRNSQSISEQNLSSDKKAIAEMVQLFETKRAPKISSKKIVSRQPQLTIYKNSLASNQLSSDIHLVNSYLFDQLLTQPQIEGNQYQEKAGLIKSTSTSDSKTLKLFLSEDLTKQQFYCLLNQAKEHQVSLELYVAKDVKIPDANLQKFTQEFELDRSAESTETRSKPTDPAGGVDFSARRISRESSPSPKSPRIIITNNIEESLKELIKALESSQSESSRTKTINLVNVEDILYGDLFGKNQHKIVTKDDGSQHFAFEKIETALKAKLEAGETVILKGEFSHELLSLLHPQILDLQKNFSNLHFIIEDKNVSKSRPRSSKLSWLDPSFYEVKYSPEVAKKTMEGKIAREDYPIAESSIPHDSEAQADTFIKERKDKLLEFLQENPILQIFGHSGVGKSSLLRNLKESGLKEKNDVAVYNELSSLEAWSQDKSAKTKILVIDEFNVDGSTNFTLFRDLANNPTQFPREIFHDGKSVTLTENHKVVFLGNPPNYGNRFTQKLFEDCQIPEWHLQDFPASYIYEEILAKPIYAGLSPESKEKLSEEDFKKIAIEKIKDYKAKNQGDPQTKDILPSETVRELQEKVLKEIVEIRFPIKSSPVQNANFIETEANQQNIAELQSAIEIRKLQKSDKLPPQFLGTCGVIFEGDSGVGKSVMIEAVLENRGIKKIDSLEDLKQEIAREKISEIESEISPTTKPHYYYKIPASLPIEEINKQLIKAFELGVIIVFDEMNTRIKEGGLEKTINALLTGQHPENSTIKPQAGFMLIASVNKATNAGRSALSPAIIHRSTVIKAKSLSEYRAQDFEKIIGNWVENEGKQKGEIGKDGTQQEKISFAEKPNKKEIEEASEAIKKLVETQPKKLKNLRDLQKIIPEVLSELKNKNNELTRADSLGK
jgi:hypothetical protein